MGEPNPTALKDSVREKNNKYKAWHEDQGYTFIPLVVTTHGSFNSNSVLLIMLFTHKTTLTYFSERMPNSIMTSQGGYTKTFVGHHARFLYRYKARVSLSVARATATRGSLVRGPKLIKSLRKVNLSELEFKKDLPLGPMHA
mmetsp:Transcript_31010/g.64363  ORF Transcript_31010/g.64363 Transcript_31010/m.64363 type:complete len:142 (-) Transcript_31010:90-515(-)